MKRNRMEAIRPTRKANLKEMSNRVINMAGLDTLLR